MEGRGRKMKNCMRRWIAVLVMGFSLLAWSTAILAGEPANEEKWERKMIEGVSLSDLIAYAYRVNPSVKAARAEWKSIVERYRIETAYPDPELAVSTYPKPLMARYEVMISQLIPFPGKLSQMGEVVKAEIEMARLELDRILRDTLTGIRESYYELLYIKEAKKVVALNRDLLEHMLKVGETTYAQNQTTFFDVVKAQSQLAQLQYDAILLEELEQTERAQMNSFLNRPPNSKIHLLEEKDLPPMVYPLEEIYELAQKHREEIRLIETEIQKAKAKIGVARYESLPDFKLGASYAQGNPDMVPEEFRDAIGVQFGITIPLWFNKSKGRLEAARAEEKKALSMKAAQINETRAMIRNAYFRFKNSERLIRLYRDQLLPQAAKAIEISESWFREKQGSFTDFIETQSVFYNFQLFLARAKADYGRNLAQLEKLAGVSLTRKGENRGGSKPKEKGR